MVRGSLIAVVAALLLVPTATARPTAAAPLAVLPVPKQDVGAAARGLTVARDSGVVSNADAANQSSSGVTSQRLKRLGRKTGYLLDYGTPFGSGPGIHQVETEVEVYGSPAQAANALVFWRKDASETKNLAKMGIKATAVKAPVPALGTGRWAYNQSLTIPGVAPLQGYSAEILEGSHLLNVSVSAGSASAATRLGQKLVRKLDARFRLGERGRLSGKPVPLPPPLKPGPPTNGPAPSGMVLKPSDLGGKTKKHGAYAHAKSALDRNALSVYDLTLISTDSAQKIGYATQEVTRAATPTEATYFAAVGVLAISAVTVYAPKAKATTVDVGSAGDHARGVLIELPIPGGQTVYEAAVVLSRGSYIDFVLAASRTTLTASDVQALAAKVAQRFDAGF